MKFEVVEECADELLNDREQHWIRELGTLSPDGYNLTTGGDVCEFSEETKAKMSTARQQNSIDKKGYVGSISKCHRLIQATGPDRSYLGSYSTCEEAEEALREYTRDPENFVPNLSKRKLGSGSVYKIKNGNGRLAAKYKRKHLGRFDTEAQAEAAILAHKEKIFSAEGKKPV